MTEEQIKHMVSRFLNWRLPEPWNPDNGISYKRPNYAHAPADHDWPVGTNLFGADQAEAMTRHMLEGLPQGWQPIETAPKSTAEGSTVRGIYILGYCPEEGADPQSCICVMWWEPLQNNGRGEWQGEAGFPLRPTRWCPQPEPPTT